MKEAGIDLTPVKTFDDEVTGLALITVSDSGENTIVVVPGANARMDADLVAESTSIIEDADLVLLQGEIPTDGIEKAITLTKGRVVVNLAPVVDVDPDTLRKSDPLIVNEHEAGLVLDALRKHETAKATGTTTDTDAETTNPNDLVAEGIAEPEAMVRALIDAGFRSVVLTLGEQGALVAKVGDASEPSTTTTSDNASLITIPTASVTAVDTTGAGDAFAGALCAKLVDGETLVEASRYAARVGAFAVTRRGAQTSYPKPDDKLPDLP